jgi:competence protein ComEA
MKTVWAIGFGLIGGLLGAGVLLLIASPPRGDPITLSPPPTPAPIKVHITGAVDSPEVYALERHARVEDAIQAAGGMLPDARKEAVNLAARAQDGAQIFIPPATLTGTVISEWVSTPGTQAFAGPDSPVGGGGIDIIRAEQSALESLPGIGPVTAAKIIEYRQEHGPFTTVEQIQEVSGIGPATFDRIQGLISVSPSH